MEEAWVADAFWVLKAHIEATNKKKAVVFFIAYQLAIYKVRKYWLLVNNTKHLDFYSLKVAYLLNNE